MTLTLYHNDLSTCAQKVRLVLAEKGLRWESEYLDLRAGDQRRAEYLAVNPAGIVPTLVHDGATLTESTVIIEYLDDAFPDLALRPTDAGDRARMRLWMKRIDDEVHAMVGVLSFALAFRHEFLALPDEGQSLIAAQKNPMHRMVRAGLVAQGADFPGVGQALGACMEAFAAIDEALTEDHLVGGYSLADAAWTPYLHRLKKLGLGDLWSRHPHVAAWWERLKARPSYETAITGVEKPERIEAMTAHAADARPRVDQWLSDMAEAA